MFSHKGRYDTVLLLGRNIGIAQTLDGIADLLHKCETLLRPGGVVITNSVREEPESATAPSDDYPGNLCFRIRYKEQIGDWVRWLHVDSKRLKRIAEGLGWRTEIIREEPEGDFSAVLHSPPQTGG
jgi:predicted O-methyltransferase YrrM